MRNWLIKKLGGLPMRGLTEEEKADILTQATAEFFNTVGKKDILQRTGDGILWAGKLLTEGQVTGLRNDAQAFQRTFLFKVLDAELRWHCNLRMRQATTLMELEGAKCVEFVWDVIKTRLGNL